MRASAWVKALGALSALVLLAAACGDDDTDTTTPTTTTTMKPASGDMDDAEGMADENVVDDDMTDDEGMTDDDAIADDEGMADTDMAADDMAADDMMSKDLSEVCPSPLIIQTDWFPESEHGAMYQMVASDYTIDASNQVTTGSLIIGDTDTGIDIEIRAGGPAIGFASGSVQMYIDREIHLAYISTDGSIILGDDTPTIAVVAPLEKNPQIIQWDPETYPDVSSIADLGEKGIVVNVFGGGTFIDVFVNEGVLSADQIDPSYNGSPTRFIAEEGAIAQQGFASESPYSYEIAYEEWAKPIAFELIHDAGLRLYSQTLAVRKDNLEALRPCLERFVPIVQQSVLDFAADPARANAIIIDAVETIDSFWEYSPGLADFSVQTQKDLGLIGNGPDGIVGNMDEDRINEVIDKITAAGFDVTPGLRFEDIATNEFIDESIGF